jgi:hypothetical protein
MVYLTDELEGLEYSICIVEFFSGGPKNYVFLISATRKENVPPIPK